MASNQCMFVKKHSSDDFIIFLLYIDDMLIIRYDARKIEELKKELNKSFAMKKLRTTKKILGMKISPDRKMGSYGYLKKATVRSFLKDST